VLGALMLGPLLSGLADQVLRKLIDQRGSTNAPVVQAFGVQYALPGVRVALWIGGLLIIAASILAARSIDLRFRQNLRTLGGDVRRANGDST
jgi:hypothetical protein